MAPRIIIHIFVLGMSLLIFSGQLMASNTAATVPNYGRLLDFIQIDDLTDPLMVFGGVEENFDRQLNQENIAYLNTNRNLLQQIQSHLSGDSLKWRLGTSFKQVWVVPESRDEYAQLFEQYCRDAVAYLLTRIQMPSPYDAIATLREPHSDSQLETKKGVTAYLVHNIADEYIEEYLFFEKDHDEKQIKIKLSNREFDGKIGSYTSKLKIGPNNQFEFIREKFTLWQNSARNPFNVLIVPIEETLHIILRTATEHAMHAELTFLQPEKIQDVKGVIDHWMAVEEAVVGGLVWQVMPQLVKHVINGISEFPLAQTMAERDAHDQYRFLDKGIDLVDHLGIDKTMALYQRDAQSFRTRLLDTPPDFESAQLFPSPSIVY